MESPNLLSSFVALLRESHLIFVKNRKFVASISLLILLVHSSLFLCSFFSLKPLIQDIITQEILYLQSTILGSSEYTKTPLAIAADFYTFDGLTWFFILAFSIASLFSSAITVLASAMVYGELNLSFKDLIRTVLKSLKRPLTTWFYIALFEIGYISFAFLFILPILFNFGNPFQLSISSYVILILAAAFYTYLDVFGKLSIVIAVLEEKSGVEAIGKAMQLAKGAELQGFLLNVLFGILGFLVFKSWTLVITVKSEAFILLTALLIHNIACLIKMQAWMAFTVFYCVSKQTYGEEIELQGALEYTKASTHEPHNAAEIP